MRPQIPVPSAVLRHSVARPAVRRRLPQFNATRFASSNANPTVEAAQKKAQDALASAQKTAGKVFESSKKALGPAGEKAGQMLGCEWSKSTLSSVFVGMS